MSTKSYTSLCRFSAYAFAFLLLGSLLCNGAQAQGTTPLVTASFAQGLTHPTGWATIQQTAIDTFGDWLVVDYPNAALYEFPAGGGAMITLAGPGTLGSVGGYQNPGIAIDSNNNLYIEANYNNCLLMFPYDTATKTWDGLSTLTTANPTTNVCPNSGKGTSPYIFAQYGITINSASGAYPGYFQPWGIAVDSSNNLIIGSQNSPNFIFSLSVTGSGASAKPGPGQMILDQMEKRPISVAVDKYENIYFVEDSGGLSGVYEVPAGNTDVASDTASVIVRVDPNLPNVTGVITDPNGNLYISDGTDGVFMVPNPSGTPNPSAAVLLTPVPAQGEVAIDWTRDILYVPTTQTQSNGQADVAEVTFNAAELGSTATASPTATAQSVLFGFDGTATPGSFVIEEAGTANPDFTLGTGGTCTVGTAYNALGGCSEQVTLTPHAAGSVSAKLLMLDSSGNILSAMTLHGVGTGSAVQVLPSDASTLGSGLKTPTQIAVDPDGNTYVADSGLAAVEMYPKGGAAATAIGTGLTTPTGVAVDGAGDVFIADSGSGTVVEVPNSPTGLNAAGQVTLKTGLGTNLLLAADGSDNLYISDPINHRIVKLGGVGVAIGVFSLIETDITGFNAPSALAVDSSNNVYVADGSNLIEITAAGAQSTLLTSLTNATGLAVDPSGAVYVASAGGVVRIPLVSGTLTPSSQTLIATNVTNPTSVALDQSGNVYITDATAGDVAFLSADALVNFGTLSSPSATQTASVTVLDYGNAALNVTGFTSTPDFSATSNTCVGGPVAVGTTCSATLTFAPGPGDQGNLSGQILLQSDAANAPVGVNVLGVGAALANSTTTIAVTNATVNGATVTITVAPATGTTPVPTGTVTVTISGNGITPVVLSGTLNNGTISFTPTQIPAGSYTFTAVYSGDRVYSGSQATQTVAVAAGAVTITQPTMAQVQQDDPYYPYVLSSTGNNYEPYDGSQNTWNYTYTVQVVPTDGSPLIGQPVYDSNGKLVAENYGTVTFQGAPYTGGVGCPPVPVNSDGTAPLNTTCLTITATNSAIPNIMNTYTVTPAYSPAGSTTATTGYTNPNYTAATGTAITFTALADPMVSISSSPSTMSITAGSSSSATITLTSILGYGHAGINGLEHNFSLPVQLQCDGLPAYATCSFTYPNPDASDPQSVDVGPAPGTVLTGGTVCNQAQGCVGPGTVIMTITTNLPTGVARVDRRSGETVFAAMLGFGLLGLAFGKRKALRSRLITLACLVLCCGILAGVSGCSTTQLGGGTGTPTPAGTYNVLVTAREVGSGPVSPGPPYITYGSNNQVSLPFTMKVTVQ
jgi:hypothetical protein